MVNQFKKMVGTIEKIYNIKLDPARLKQAVDYSLESFIYFLKINELCKNNPIPISIIDAMDGLNASLSLAGTNETLELAKLSYEEVKQRVKNGTRGNIKGKKPKVVWRGLRPFYNDEIIDYIEHQCNIDIIHEYNITGGIDLESLYENEDPYVMLAKKVIIMARGGVLEQFTQNEGMADMFDEYGINGVIAFNQWGCRALVSINQVLREALNRLNIPLLEIDGDYIDGRNYSFSQIKVRIDAFSELLHRRIK
jgi:benzoyl-CoA reductase/2-hydroxyglutaryl-CoA dehydratase subunit BcrC/BadD/HgdB